MDTGQKGDFNKKNIKLRFAKTIDNTKLSELIYITSPDLFLYMFGKNAKNILSGLSKNKNNLFSYEHCKAIEIDEEIAGMIQGYGFETIERESKNTGRLIMRYLGLNFVFKVFNLIKMDRIISDLKKGDYYISNVALFKEYRGYGIGRKLIEDAIKDIKKLNKNRLYLDVADNNERAIDFYYHLGFKNLKKKTINFAFNRKVSLLRMVKDVKKI